NPSGWLSMKCGATLVICGLATMSPVLKPISWCETHKCVRQHDSQRLTASPAHCRFRKTLCLANILRASITESPLCGIRRGSEYSPCLTKLLRSYPFHAILCRADRGHFSRY